MIEFPKNISFKMVASNGSWKGTFARYTKIEGQKVRINQYATIKATLIDKDNGIYKVTMIAPKPYSGPYEYQMPYSILKQWESRANEASWYNNNIRGNTAYFPK